MDGPADVSHVEAEGSDDGDGYDDGDDDGETLRYPEPAPE